VKPHDERDNDNTTELRPVPDAKDTDTAQDSADLGWEDLFAALQKPHNTDSADSAGGADTTAATFGDQDSPSRDRKAEKAAKRQARAKAKEAKTAAKRTASTPKRPALPAGLAPAAPTAPAAGREPVNPWIKRAGVAVVLVGVVGGAIAAGRAVMGEQTPVTAAPTDTALSTSVAPPPAPQTSTPSVTNRGLPPDNVTVVSGDCEPSDDQERITPSGKSLRAVIADFQDNYFHGNAEALVATISKSNKDWRDQDWDQVLAQIPKEASYCVTMQPEQGEAVVSTVRMSVPGESDQIFKQRVVGERSEQGRWLIKAMHPLDD
jgi:hypothetical protein